MTRAQKTISLAVTVSAIYLAFFFEFVPFVPQLVQEEIIPVLPFWALVSFGAYLLSSMGRHLLFFNDVPKAYDSLMKEIEMAKVDLRKKGVTVD